MRVLILSIGRPSGSGLAQAIADYEERIGRYFSFEARELRPERITGAIPRSRIKKRESERLLQAVPGDIETVAVDERGATWSSSDLAKYLGDLALLSQPGVAFLVGGALGHSSELRRRAHRILSLSTFTLPHELARLVLLEQIYRAGTILRGEPYHRER